MRKKLFYFDKLPKFPIEEPYIKNKFILGEAKFLTDYGGTQNNQFRDAISVARINKNNIIGIAVIDGIVWFKSNAYMHRRVKSLDGIALSALLLKEFISNNTFL